MRARIMTAMLVACLLLMTGLPGTGEELGEEENVRNIGPATSTTAWGMSYDWSDLPADIKDLTNVDIEQIMDDIEDAALDEASIALDLDYDVEGFTHFYVTQAPGQDKEIEMANGDDEDVYSVDTTITVRMSMTSTSTMEAMWDDNGDPAFDVDFESVGNTGFILNILMSEYYTEDNDRFAGMDLTMDGGLSFGSSFSMDATFSGGGDTVNFDGTSVSMSADITLTSMTAEWRMYEPSLIYDVIFDDDYDRVWWDCDYYDYAYDYGDGDFDLGERCGEVDYTWSTNFGYEMSMSNFPAEDLGFTSDQASFSFSDNVVESGSSNGVGMEFYTTIHIDDHDYDVGSDEYVRVEGQTPMSAAIGTVIGMGFAEIAEDADIDDPSQEFEDEAGDWENDYDEDDNDAIDIVEEFMDSDLEDDMEDFGKEMEDIMEDVADDAESKYSDAEMFWLIEKDTGQIVSPQMLVEEDNDWVQLVGPADTDEDTPSANEGVEMDYYEGAAAENKQSEVGDLSMSDVYSESKDKDDSMMMYLLIGGIAVGVFALIGIVLLMVRKKDDGGMYQENYANDAFNNAAYEMIATEMGHGSGAAPGGGMAPGMGAPPPAFNAPPAQAPAGPPVGMQGQVADDGFEWAEYPAASGAWYYRDKMTQQWVKHG